MFGGFLWYSCTSTLIQEEIEDTKEVIRIVYRKKTRQHNGKKKKHKRTNNDLQNTTQKTKDRVTRTPLKTEDELGYSGNAGSSCSTSDTRQRCNKVK
jgi:hypothetical protein